MRPFLQPKQQGIFHQLTTNEWLGLSPAFQFRVYRFPKVTIGQPGFRPLSHFQYQSKSHLNHFAEKEPHLNWNKSVRSIHSAVV